MAGFFDAGHQHFLALSPSLWDPIGRASVAAAQPGTDQRVLDACCGAGASAIPTAEAVGATGIVDADVDVEGGRLTGVRLADGHVVAVGALVAMPRAVARGGLLADLGLEASPLPMGAAFGDHVPADPTGATSVPGVWVAGNVTAPMAPVLASAAGGMTAGSLITRDLVDDDTAVAVADARAQRQALPA